MGLQRGTWLAIAVGLVVAGALGAVINPFFAALAGLAAMVPAAAVFDWLSRG